MGADLVNNILHILLNIFYIVQIHSFQFNDFCLLLDSNQNWLSVLNVKRLQNFGSQNSFAKLIYPIREILAKEFRLSTHLKSGSVHQAVIAISLREQEITVYSSVNRL